MSVLESDPTYFDASKSVAELEDDEDDFMVELFSHDRRVVRPLHSNPRQDDEHDSSFISIRAEFKTKLPVPLKLKSQHWEVCVAKACFRNLRSAVYRLKFHDSKKHVVSTVAFPRRPYYNPYELYEEIALLTHKDDLRVKVAYSTQAQQVTGGLFADFNPPGQSVPSAKWKQSCLDGPHMDNFPVGWHGYELTDPSVLWEHLLGLWNKFGINSTWHWIMNNATAMSYIDAVDPFSNFFFWDLTNEAFKGYAFPSGESLQGGWPRQTNPTYWLRDGTPVTIGTNAQGKRIVHLRARYNVPTFHYMVVSDEFASLLNVDEMHDIN